MSAASREREMEKLDPKTDRVTPDIVEQNVEQLKALFPEIVTEGKVDFETLREVLGDYTDEREERYSFTWNGKSRARRLAQTPSTGTLRPCHEESVNWDTTQNMFIEGDNLEVLKLLQKSYHKKIKMIYIDPPYNTGKDFIYPDDFRDNLDNYLRITGQADEEDRKLTANPETSGRYHTDWLNMIYPRLKLARNLLRDDGILFMSIDDNELVNLKKLGEEMFGEENHIATFIWEKRVTRENRSVVSNRHDYICCFARDASASDRAIGLLPMDEAAIARYKNPDNDPRGVWTSVPAIAQSGHGTKSQFYSLTTPSGREIDPPSGSCWRYTEDRMAEAIVDNRIWFGSDGRGVPRIKKFLDEGQQGLTAESLWWAKDVGTNDTAKRELTKLFDGRAVFDTPKPVGLVRRMLQLTTAEDDIVMDFFAGSAVTGEAVLQVNESDGSSRSFILVQLPEPTPRESEAFQCGYATIADVGKARIHRVIESLTAKHLTKMKEATGSLLEPETEPLDSDLGFKVLKLDTSNIKPWDADFDNVKGTLLSAVENVKPDRSEIDVLYELLLKFGLDLAVPMEQRKIRDKSIHIIGAGALIVCLADKIGLDVVEGIAALKDELTPETIRVVFKDAGFADDVVKTNAVQILHQAGIDDVRSL